METLVSVIMPAYNVAAYIEKSIRSVIEQEYTAWELIVVNDGSIDSTSAIVRAFGEKDSRIKLYEQENRGVSAARNRGITMASGKYLAFLDGDDLWDKSFLRKVIGKKEETQAEMVFSWYQKMDKKGQLKTFRFQSADAGDGDTLLLYLNDIVLKKIAGLHIGSVLIDKKILSQHDIFFTENCAIGEDKEFILKILSIAKVQVVREFLMTYRTREGSACHSPFNWEKSVQHIAAIKRGLYYVQEHHKNPAELESVLLILQENLRYRQYRLLWKMVKYKNHQEALRMLAEPECIESLAQIDKEKLRFNHRLKYDVIMSKNQYLWKLCTLLARQ
ncbi:glycosyltransferase [Sporomusa sphaeroides DSM 2875]|uniref:glycosyltransferase family 2 protein n=1 Tax=Sporomusa sphaeroides TaxID=47679 RepID=UPI00203016D8|nr:glycosyltransferase [Sporomusa sphaeroides]MCM0758018.1 glycosyltransferase [Sporomusa sphaeroides DSM 2875]